MNGKLLHWVPKNRSCWAFTCLGVTGMVCGFAYPAQAEESLFLNFDPPPNSMSSLPGSDVPPNARSSQLGLENTESANLPSSRLPLISLPNADLPQKAVLSSESSPGVPAPVRSLNLRRMKVQVPDYSLEALFQGGSSSLVAKAVGAAEGTRTPEGQPTGAYYGHQDPGNGVWNLGTFSYQHGAVSPEEADRKQLRRLERQATVLRQQAVAQGLELSLVEELNGIDLANQSPRAALDRGYIQRLKEARERGLRGAEAVIWARTQAYRNPETGRWNAPGLGNTAASIRRDQNRRYAAVEQVLANNSEQAPLQSPRQAIVRANSLQLFKEPDPRQTTAPISDTLQEEMATKIISIDLSGDRVVPPD